MTNKMEILLKVHDEELKQLQARFLKLEKDGSKSAKSLVQSFQAYKMQILAVTGALAGLVITTKQLIEASAKVEQYRIRMEGLLGTVEDGNRVFADMERLASRVPKTYDEIMASATNLAGVVKDGVNEINQLMPIIVDISAATGMTVQEVTGQMIRMYSAGAAAADMFRERGISAALGFKAGVSYTAEETMRTILQQWEDGTGKFVGAAQRLAHTWDGSMSMMADALFKLKVSLGDFITQSPEIIGVFDEITHSVNAFAEGLQLLRKQDALKTYLVDVFQSIVGSTEFKTFQSAIDRIYGLGVNLGRGVAGAPPVDAGPEGPSPEEIAYNKELEAKRLKTEEVEKYVTDYTRKEQEKRRLNEGKTQKDLESIRSQSNSNFLSGIKTTFLLAAGANKEFAVMLQAVNIGEAIMNTAAGVTQALKAYPPPLSFAMASLVSAMGAAQVGIIASQGFSEGTDSVPARLSPGEMIFPRTMADAIRSGDIMVSGKNAKRSAGTQIHIEINNPVVKSHDDIDDLVNAISDRLAFEAERI